MFSGDKAAEMVQPGLHDAERLRVGRVVVGFECSGYGLSLLSRGLLVGGR